MSAGIYAQLNGFKTTIIEMHDKPGGQLTSWEREGYWFDYCLHWLVGSDHGVYHEIWKETHAMKPGTEIIQHDTFVNLVHEEYGEFSIFTDLDRWEEYLMEMAPEDEEAIRELCSMMKRGDNMDQFEDPPTLRSIGDYLEQAWKVGSFWPVLIKYGKKTCKELFEDLGFKNEKLLFFLNKLFGAEDFSAIGFIMTLGWQHAQNAGYLKGGSLKMAFRMAHRFSLLKGKFKFKTRVERILTNEGRATGVELDNGETLSADYVIAACDLHNLHHKMLDRSFLDEKTDEALKNWPLFTPIVMVGFGVNDEIKFKNHNTTYMVEQAIEFGSTKAVAYSLMNRTMYDQGFAQRGKNTILMQFETSWEIWENLDGEAYDSEKYAIKNKAIEILNAHYPGIKEKIEVLDVATPKTTVHYTGVYKGAYEGFRPTSDVLNALPMKLEGLDGFYRIGQWLFPGGGLPPSAQSGKWAIQLICDELDLEFHTREPEHFDENDQSDFHPSYFEGLLMR